MAKNIPSVLTYPPKSPFVMIHQSLVDICGGKYCEAAILHQLAYWTPRTKNLEGWVWKSAKEMAAGDFFGLYSRNTVAAAFKGLEHRGFIVSRHNPKVRWDHTLQYQVQVTVVQAAIDARVSVAGETEREADDDAEPGPSLTAPGLIETPAEMSHREPVLASVRPDAVASEDRHIPAFPHPVAIGKGPAEAVLIEGGTRKQPSPPLVMQATPTAQPRNTSRDAQNAGNASAGLQKRANIEALLKSGTDPWQGTEGADALYLAYLHAKGVAGQAWDTHGNAMFPDHLTEVANAVGFATPAAFHAASKWLRKKWGDKLPFPRPMKVFEEIGEWRNAYPMAALLFADPATLPPFPPDDHRHRYCPSYWEIFFKPGTCDVTKKFCATVLRMRQDPTKTFITEYDPNLIDNRNKSSITTPLFIPEGYVFDEAEYAEIKALADTGATLSLRP